MTNIIENALYIVATPIGNLSDITLRAIDILRKCDIILCENPKNSYNLLKYYEIDHKKIDTYNDHSDEKQRLKILNLLLNKKSISLISDAGTPLISDPGYKLIRFLKQNNQKIIPIPGASALTATISASGLASDSFIFLGFLPNNKNKRHELISQNFDKNIVFYVTARDLITILKEILETVGARNCCIAKEITKIYEEIITDDLSKIIDYFSQNPNKIKGEFVIMIEKNLNKDNKINQDKLISEIKKLQKQKYSHKDISQILSEIYKVHKKEIYQIILEINKDNN